MSSGNPFEFHLRRENNHETLVTVRFEVLDGGMGILGLRVPGRTDPAPSLHTEEHGIEADALRAGRFVHVVTGGSRQSYALSRITPELIESLRDDEWVTLEAVTEYGFRYLVAPAGFEGRAPGAAVQLEPVKQSAVSEKIGAAAGLLKAPRPASVASAAATGTPSTSPDSTPTGASTAVAPRQVPVAPALADAALAALSLDDAVRYLREEMAKVQALHAHAAELETQLAASRAREADLLEVLSRWQSR